MREKERGTGTVRVHFMSCMPDHPSGLPTVVSTGLSGIVCGDMRAALLQALRARVLSTEAAVDNELLV